MGTVLPLGGDNLPLGGDNLPLGGDSPSAGWGQPFRWMRTALPLDEDSPSVGRGQDGPSAGYKVHIKAPHLLPLPLFHIIKLSDSSQKRPPFTCFDPQIAFAIKLPNTANSTSSINHQVNSNHPYTAAPDKMSAAEEQVLRDPSMSPRAREARTNLPQYSVSALHRTRASRCQDTDTPAGRTAR